MADFFKKHKPNKLLLTGQILVFLIIIVAVTAPLLAPCDPNGVKVEDRLQIPGEHNFMGTDGFGRDILSRVIYGARFFLTLAVVVAAVNFALGLLIGSVAGYFGGFLVIPGWAGYARIARGMVLSVKDQIFISAARALGAGNGYIILRHVIPNVISPLIVLPPNGDPC